MFYRTAKKDEIRAIEKYAIEVIGIPSILLMENAALKVIKNINLLRRDTFAIICGVGNNGADGLAIARNLISLDKEVHIYLIGSLEEATEEFIFNYKILKRIDAKISPMETLGDLEDFKRDINKVNTIIDAITGLGFTGGLEGMAEYMAEIINRSRIYTISVDLPSGMEADQGLVNTIAINPSLVVTFQYMKEGLVNNKLLKDCQIVVESIGIPRQAERHILRQKVNL